MTHTKQMSDSDGEFSEWKDHPQPCNKMVDRDGFHSTCGAKVQLRAWCSHDEAYVDYQYRCEQGHQWWIDGIDS